MHRKNSHLHDFSNVSLFVSSMNCFQAKRRVVFPAPSRLFHWGQRASVPWVLTDIPIYCVQVTWRQPSYTLTKHLYRVFENERMIWGCCVFTPDRYTSSFSLFVFINLTSTNYQETKSVSNQEGALCLSPSVGRIDTMLRPSLMSRFFNI